MRTSECCLHPKGRLPMPKYSMGGANVALQGRICGVVIGEESAGVLRLLAGESKCCARAVGKTAASVVCHDMTCSILRGVSRCPHVPKVQLTHQYQTDDFTHSQLPAQDTHPSSFHIDSLLPLLPFSPSLTSSTSGHRQSSMATTREQYTFIALSISLTNNFLPLYIYT